MYNTGNFSEFCSEEWDLNTGKWDLVKTNGLGNSLSPPPPPSVFRTLRKRNLYGMSRFSKNGAEYSSVKPGSFQKQG